MARPAPLSIALRPRTNRDIVALHSCVFGIRLPQQRFKDIFAMLNQGQANVLLGLSVAALVALAALLTVNWCGGRQQRLLLAQQEEINRGQMAQQLGSGIIQDLAPIANRNPRVLALLRKMGVNQAPAAGNLIHKTGRP